jgi:hypothetical protein
MNSSLHCLPPPTAAPSAVLPWVRALLWTPLSVATTRVLPSIARLIITVVFHLLLLLYTLLWPARYLLHLLFVRPSAWIWSILAPVRSPPEPSG